MTGTKGPALDDIAFEKLRRIAPNALAVRRAAASGHWQPVSGPEEVAFKLTNRCDLRCSHCYQWGEGGYHHYLQGTSKGGDLDLDIVRRVLAATRANKSNLYLWGGEPLLYRHWDGLIDLLSEDPRWTSLCTNGTMIGRRLESLLRISEWLEMSVSIEGFEAEHDMIRGAGSYRRTMDGLMLLIEKQKAGRYLGEVTVNVVITDPMVGRVYDFLREMQMLGVGTVYVSYPWYISQDTSRRMDAYYAEHFDWPAIGPLPSWASYQYRLDPQRIDALIADVKRIDSAEWSMKVRYNPELSTQDLIDFVGGSHVPAQNKTRCHSTRTRMDVFPDGQVVSCKFFPEFRMGDLAEQAVMEIWNGERFDHLRKTVAQCGLMPVCAKCNLLYTRGG
jgi:radical SAM protein with 4Fe4S-binding SPASM domain